MRKILLGYSHKLLFLYHGSIRIKTQVVLVFRTIAATILLLDYLLLSKDKAVRFYGEIDYIW
jgi:hypothetical protein